MPQRMIHQHNRQHRFGNWRCADANAGVVAAVRDDFDRLTLLVNRAARQADAGSGFDRDRCDDVLPGGNAT